MIPKELAKKIKYLQIYTSKAVNDILAGEYESVFKGRGMEFDEVREYQLGDEVRDIDWNVTARMGHPYVKRFVEEREVSVMFLVDLSASGTFGSIQKRKNEVAAELCALLAFAAIKNNDKVGLIVFTDTIELFVPPAKGVSHVLRLIRELLNFQPNNSKTNIAVALNYLGKITHKRNVVFLVSDFICQNFTKPMSIVNRRHDLIAIPISDPREHQLPNAGIIQLEDAETGEQILIDTSSKKTRSQYQAIAKKQKTELQQWFRSKAIDYIPISTQGDYLRDLITFFRSRERRQQMS